MHTYIKTGFVVTILLLHSAVAETIHIGRFSEGALEDWQSKSFSGETQYSITQMDELENLAVLQAHSSASASGLIREIKVDLKKTPYLNWSWKIENIVPGPDERTKPGDDYPARVYVVVSGGIAFWKTKSLNYVWANRLDVGTQWPNAYTGQAQMLALKSGSDLAGEWVTERRNVKLDFQEIFGEDIVEIDAVAIMTDTDQSGGEARAWYGDIWFSSE